MGKAIFLGLMLVVAMAITMTTSFVYPPPGTPSAVENIPPTISKDKESSSSEESSDDDDYDKSEDSSEFIDDKEQMICNVIVRATHDLHVLQGKSADEIMNYLDTDCKNLENEELIEQCREMVTEHGVKIYEQVTSGVEMSQVCKKIEDRDEMALEDERTAQCSHKGGNKCKCCKIRVEKRKMRLRYIVKQIAKKRMCMCKRSSRPHRCRQWIRRKERRVLRRIEKICPYTICKHLGYCKALPENDSVSKLLVEPKISTVDDSPSLWLGLLDQQLEAYLTKNVCGEFEQLQKLCIHLAASIDNRRYAKIYMAVLRNDTKWIDSSLHEEVQSVQASANVGLCDVCKNIIQSSANSYLQILETVHDALDSTCEQYPVKEKFEQTFNKQLNTIKSYLHSLKHDELCSAVHHCPLLSSPVLVSINGHGECAICIQRLQPRKDAAIQAVNRLSDYFTDLCSKLDMPQCQQFVSEMVTESRSFINEFDVQGTCLAMGFCEQNAAHDIDEYEHAFVEEIGKEVCSMLGPFEALCQQVIQGNSKQAQTVSLNVTNFLDPFLRCEEEGDEENAVAVTTNHCTQDKDKCQCCIDRVIQKKKCAKKRVAKYIWHMLHLCKRCPAQKKCEHYWEEKKACWDAKIDKICPKKVCIRMGYCKKAATLSMCAYMGPFRQTCEQAFNTVTQLFEEEHDQSFAVVTGSASVQPKDENGKEVLCCSSIDSDPLMDSF
jgi:hypothetical protein